ncbi:MAG: hypothetical protein J5758_01695 [Abditibacteriota bacterium]|nr:hypothetical protein [Abditibacteriota bacterium]
MKHYIIAKFTDKSLADSLLPDIRALFDRAGASDGVAGVAVHGSCSDRENRFHVMIEMTLSAEGPALWDSSPVHREWKDRYGPLLAAKAIFDCE